jgi:alcohol dehydrogenase (cytochrome c)
MRIRALTLALLLAPALFFGQQLTPEMLLHPPASTWPTYNGDYSGRRYSSL